MVKMKTFKQIVNENKAYDNVEISNVGNGDLSVIDMLKVMKLPYKEVDRIYEINDKADFEIEMIYGTLATGDYFQGIKNFNQSTNWKDYKEYHRSFKEISSLLKYAKTSLSRYRKQGCTLYVSKSSHLKNIIYVIK